MVLQGFEEVFEKYLKGAFGMMQRDVRCIQNGHWPLQKKKLAMHFENESENGRNAICKQKGFGPKKVWHIFVETGFIRHRDHSLIFGKFSEQDKIGSLCKTRI